MRMLLTASIPSDTGNAAIRDGSLAVTMRHMLEILKPEASYFFADDDGNRSALLVFEMERASDIPSITEPFFLGFGARISIRPVMTAQDLAEGLAGAQRVVKEMSGAAAV